MRDSGIPDPIAIRAEKGIGGSGDPIVFHLFKHLSGLDRALLREAANVILLLGPNSVGKTTISRNITHQAVLADLHPHRSACIQVDIR